MKPHLNFLHFLYFFTSPNLTLSFHYHPRPWQFHGKGFFQPLTSFSQTLIDSTLLPEGPFFPFTFVRNTFPLSLAQGGGKRKKDADLTLCEGEGGGGYESRQPPWHVFLRYPIIIPEVYSSRLVFSLSPPLPLFPFFPPWRLLPTAVARSLPIVIFFYQGEGFFLYLSHPLKFHSSCFNRPSGYSCCDFFRFCTHGKG